MTPPPPPENAMSMPSPITGDEAFAMRWSGWWIVGGLAFAWVVWVSQSLVAQGNQQARQTVLTERILDDLKEIKERL